MMINARYADAPPGSAPRRDRGQGRAALTLVAAVLAALPVNAPARAVEPGPNGRLAAVGAALVYNIARFSTWPEGDADGTFDVCLADEDALPAFRSLEDRKVGDRSVRVKAVGVDDVLLANCQVFYLPGEASDGLPREAPYGTLVVGTGRNLLRDGGAVRIGLDGERPAFAFNVTNAVRAGVEPSSQLLQLAQEVVR